MYNVAPVFMSKFDIGDLGKNRYNINYPHQYMMIVESS